MKTSTNKDENPDKSISKLQRDVKKLTAEQNRLHSMLKITKELAGEINLEQIIFKIMEEVQQVLEADRCTVFLLDEEKNELWSKAAVGLKEEIRFPADKGIAGHVCQTGEILNIRDAYKDERFNSDIDNKTGYKTKTVLTLPMRNKLNEVIGVFQVLNKKTGTFTKDHEELLTAISTIAASSVENAQLHSEQKKSLVSFIETLSSTMDTRDYITAGHSRRVTLYAMEIGRIMKLDSETLEILRFAGLLHDIGKIGVPELVLYKDRKLTEDEYEIIKGHARITKELLQKIHFHKKYRDLPTIAASHHERIDGTGYPEKMKGDDIPLGGKILAVADVFDALTSRRQFRDRLELEKVVQVLDMETGTAFEPFVVYNFKFLRLDRLIQILEYGHTDEMDKEDLEKLRAYNLRDMLVLRSNTTKTDLELEIENIFMRYYLRQYRTT